MIGQDNPLAMPLISPEAFQDILRVVKALGNESRLQILIGLRGGEQSFQTLLQETGLHKTALANHLTQLLEAGLVKKPDHGKYALSKDGTILIRGIIESYEQSLARVRRHIEETAKGGLSEDFLSDFFAKNK